MSQNLYHSALVKMKAVKVTVKSDVLKSKFKGKPPYVILSIDGEDYSYNTENDECAEFFEGQKGRTFTIIAEGRDTDAVITYVGESAPDPDSQSDAPEEGNRRAGNRPPRNASARGNKSSNRPPPAEKPAQTAKNDPPTQDPPRELAKGHTVDFVDEVINLRRYLGKRGNALRLAADESLRIIESFHKAHGLPWDDKTKLMYVQLVAQNMANTTFSTIFISADRPRYKSKDDFYRLDTFPAGDLDKFIEEAKKRLSEEKDQAEKERQRKIEEARKVLAEAGATQ